MLTAEPGGGVSGFNRLESASLRPEVISKEIEIARSKFPRSVSAAAISSSRRTFSSAVNSINSLSTVANWD